MKINVGIDANNGKIKENTLLAVVFNVISFPLSRFYYPEIVYDNNHEITINNFLNFLI